MIQQGFTICLWFEGNLEEKAKYYTGARMAHHQMYKPQTQAEKFWALRMQHRLDCVSQVPMHRGASQLRCDGALTDVLRKASVRALCKHMRVKCVEHAWGGGSWISNCCGPKHAQRCCSAAQCNHDASAVSAQPVDMCRLPPRGSTA
jgi:hypothetical protein